MLNTTDAYKSAIVEEPRKIRPKIPARVADADMQRALLNSSAAAPVSHGAQVVDGNLHMSDSYVTLERNRWVLDGSGTVLPDDYAWDGETGFVSDILCDKNGTFSGSIAVRINVSGVEALRAVSIYFSDNEADGTAADFTVVIYTKTPSGLYTQRYKTEITGNTEPWYLVQGFTVANPARIRVDITKWSLPYRRARVCEIYPGYAIDWTEDDITALSVKRQTSLTAMQQPYGTATVTLDNTAGVFNPIDKSSLFQSIEEGQGFPVELGVDTEDGGAEYVPLGVFYHHNRGWAMSDSGMTMRFNLVDIIGLLSDVTFSDPETLPTTLGGWLSALVRHLGPQFEGHFALDPADYLPDYSLVLETEPAEEGEDPPKSAMHGKTCSEVLRLICQATGCIAMARPTDGYLLLRSAYTFGPDYTLDNLSDVPVYSANDYLASITFREIDMGQTDEEGNAVLEDDVIHGDETSTRNTATVSNPFITVHNAAMSVAERIFSNYGGNKISVTGRGDPSAELGDFVTVENRDGTTAAGRITQQTFQLSGGVLQGCKVDMLHAETSYSAYANRVVFTEDGSWTVPEGVTEIYLVLVGGGDGGNYGEYDPLERWPTPYSAERDGWRIGMYTDYASHAAYPDGVPYTNYQLTYNDFMPSGADGHGGKILAQPVTVNPGMEYSISIGEGGTAGTVVYWWGVTATPATAGTPTTFGTYSSAEGRTYDPRYVDVYAGGAYGRSGTDVITPNTGDGGKGGKGAYVGYGTTDYYFINFDTARADFSKWGREPYAGNTSKDGAKSGTGGSSGVCVIYYNDGEATE